MKDKLFGLVPVIGAALLGLVLSNLTMGDTAPATAKPQSAFDTIGVGPSYPQVKEDVPPADGAGYKPEVETAGQCNCVDCLDEADVRRIVRDELKNNAPAAKVVAKTVSPTVTQSQPVVTYSAPVVTYSTPSVVYSSPAVTYSQPTTTTVRRGVFGRTIYRTTTPASGTCRIVNGVRVCN